MAPYAGTGSSAAQVSILASLLKDMKLINARNRSIFSLNHWQILAVSFAFWTIYASLDSAGSVALLKLRGQFGIPLSDVILWNFSEAYIWVLFTPVICELTARFGFTAGVWKRSLAIHLIAGIIMMTVAAWLLLLPTNYLGSLSTRARVFGLALQDFPRYFITVALAQTAWYYTTLRDRDVKSAGLETQLARAQLENLRSQLQPHFLFNALNSIATLSTTNPPAAEQMTLQLSSLLRSSLNCSASQFIPLEQELSFLGDYLDIQRTRFRDRLTVQIEIDPQLLVAKVPSLILQPLVENAIQHGIAKVAGPGHILIAASREHDFIKIKIADNGAGANFEHERQASGLGLGLTNTRARLAQLYGADHQFVIERGDRGGCQVTLAVPIGNRLQRK